MGDNMCRGPQHRNMGDRGAEALDRCDDQHELRRMSPLVLEPAAGYSLEQPEEAARLGDTYPPSVYEALVEASLDGTLLVDGRGTIVLTNGEAARMFGYRREELLGAQIEKLVPCRLTRSHRAQRKSLTHSAAAHRIGTNRDVVGLRKDGTEFPLEVSLAPVHTENASDLMFAVCRDVTHERDALAASERLKQDFMATVSHELRTPLTSLLGYGEMMEDLPGVQGEARRFLGVMMRSARRELAVISDLLTLTAIDSGDFTTRLAPIDLRDVAYRNLEHCQAQAVAHGVRLRTEVPDAPVPVSGDEAKLVDAVSRMVANSVILTPAGGEVTLRVSSGDGEGVLEVVDHGPGISESEQPFAFDRLYRTASARRGEIPGIGIGLTIAKSIVEAHGGTLAIRESSRTGTTLGLALPLDERNHAPDDETAQSPPATEVLARVLCPDFGLTASTESHSQEANDSPTSARVRYLAAAVSGRRQDALKIVREVAANAGSIADVYSDILQSAQYEVGRRWETASLTIAEEHMATATAQYILAALDDQRPRSGSNGRTAVVAGVANEQHIVGASVVANVLADAGWDVRFLGADLPRDAVVSAVEQHRAGLVAISVTMSDHLHDARALIAQIRRSTAATPRIIVGGGAFRRDLEMWRSIGADGFAADARGVAELAGPPHLVPPYRTRSRPTGP